jgi:hypothetical protein
MFENHYSELFSSGAQQTIERGNYLFRELVEIWLKPPNLGDDRQLGARIIEFSFKILIIKLPIFTEILLFPIGYSFLNLSFRMVR